MSKGKCIPILFQHDPWSWEGKFHNVIDILYYIYIIDIYPCNLSLFVFFNLDIELLSNMFILYIEKEKKRDDII